MTLKRFLRDTILYWLQIFPDCKYFGQAFILWQAWKNFVESCLHSDNLVILSWTNLLTFDILSIFRTCILGLNSYDVCPAKDKHWPWYSLSRPLSDWNPLFTSPGCNMNDIIWKSLCGIMVNGVPWDVPRPKTLEASGHFGFGLGPSLGTPIIMIPPRLFLIMSKGQVQKKE